jgi:SAM-dependent methyltransferase
MSSADRLKPPARWVIRHFPGRRVRWGTFRRARPFSDCYGWDRGLPVDRFYIERFLASVHEDIRGDVLEVRDADYTLRFGGGRVGRAHIVDIDAENPKATLIADLCERGSLGAGRFDCVILTQTLHLVRDDGAAIENVWRALRPGGTLLLTVPCLSRIDHDDPEGDLWRFTPRGLAVRLRELCPAGEVTVEGHGNVLAGVAFWAGVAVEEVRPAQLAEDDPFFPIVGCARVAKTA